MIEIRRTFNPSDGLRGVERLDGYTFSSESFAHTFVVERTDGDTFEGYISARFLRADGVTVVIADTERANVDGQGNARITLSPECYAVPGRFLLTLLHTLDSTAEVIYAATGTVLDTESDTEILSSGTARTIEGQVNEALGAAWSAALFARNIGEIESNQQTIQAAYDGIGDALANAGVWALNGPNMLSQEFWTNSGGSNFVYGDGKRWLASGRPWVKSIRRDTEYTYDTEPSDKGDAYYVETVEEEDGQTVTTYHVFKDEDEIRTSVAALAEPVTDSDGASYTHALQFAVTGVTSGHLNAEELIFNQGHDGVTREADGQTVTYPPIGQLPMTDGETYTLSCWARLTSGEQACLRFAYGRDGYGNQYNVPDAQEYFEIEGSAWQRVTWTFVYHNTISARTMYPRVGIGVCRKYTGTVQLCGFRLTKGGLYGSDTVDTLRAQLKELTARVAALEAAGS